MEMLAIAVLFHQNYSCVVLLLALLEIQDPVFQILEPEQVPVIPLTDI